jgi:hypothetical protein
MFEFFGAGRLHFDIVLSTLLIPGPEEMVNFEC